jgi:hypothetical protein
MEAGTIVLVIVGVVLSGALVFIGYLMAGGLPGPNRMSPRSRRRKTAPSSVWPGNPRVWMCAPRQRSS